MTQNRPIIPVGVGVRKPSILRGWFGGLIENIPLQNTANKDDDIRDVLSPWRNRPYDIVGNLTMVVREPSPPGSRFKKSPGPVTVKADSLNPVHTEILGILSNPGGDRNLRDISPAEHSDNAVLSSYYEMAKRRSAVYLSRGQTDEMTNTLFASHLYDQLEGIESHFGTAGSLRQGFNMVGSEIKQGKTNIIGNDSFESTNLIFSIGRPRPNAFRRRNGFVRWWWNIL